jgi:hypothetical protein
MSCHSRHMLSGIHLWICLDKYPPQTSGMTKWRDGYLPPIHKYDKSGAKSLLTTLEPTRRKGWSNPLSSKAKCPKILPPILSSKILWLFQIISKGFLFLIMPLEAAMPHGIPRGPSPSYCPTPAARPPGRTRQATSSAAGPKPGISRTC